jgi:hypothetical protein
MNGMAVWTARMASEAWAAGIATMGDDGRG